MRTGMGPGRPSKGDRRIVACRHPRGQADAIEELARMRGLTLTEVMVALTAVGLKHLDEAKLPAEREVLPQTA
jgi:prepilin-type N-terminal cleavage/methylation domain-containing protein